MIKLKDLLHETSDIPSVDGAGQLWPFSDRESYARAWATDRMKDLFDSSLLGMERSNSEELSYITKINDIDDLASHKPAGKSGDHWHTEENENILGDWEFVKNTFDMSEVDRVASDEPSDTSYEVTQNLDKDIK